MYRPRLMDFAGPQQDPAWQAALDSLAPPADQLSTLKLVWEPGDPWGVEDEGSATRAPSLVDGSVHRWVVYQMLPLERTPQLVLPDLFGPSPRLRGRYDRILQRFIPDPQCNITQRQWDMFRESKRYGVPYWIVQGTRGGHKRRWNKTETAISRLHGGPKEPPLPGALPFAPFDNRVIAALAKMDRVRNAAFLLERAQRDPRVMQKFEQEELDALREHIWDRWLADQVKDAMDLAPRQALADFTYNLPRLN